MGCVLWFGLYRYRYQKCSAGIASDFIGSFLLLPCEWLTKMLSRMRWLSGLWKVICLFRSRVVRLIFWCAIRLIFRKRSFLKLDPEVRDYEPAAALIGGPTGLEFYRRFATSLGGHLQSQGKAWFEIGYQQGESVKEIFEMQGWKRCSIQKDWAGHDRFFSLEKRRTIFCVC